MGWEYVEQRKDKGVMITTERKVSAASEWQDDEQKYDALNSILQSKRRRLKRMDEMQGVI